MAQPDLRLFRPLARHRLAARWDPAARTSEIVHLKQTLPVPV